MNGEVRKMNKFKDFLRNEEAFPCWRVICTPIMMYLADVCYPLGDYLGTLLAIILGK
jgi:hypothetical protein